MMKSDRSWGYPIQTQNDCLDDHLWVDPCRLDTQFSNYWAQRWEMCTRALSREIKGYKPSSTETICSAKVRDPNDVRETWIYKIHWWIIIALLGWPCEGYIKWGLYKYLICIHMFFREYNMLVRVSVKDMAIIPRFSYIRVSATIELHHVSFMCLAWYMVVLL